MISLSVYVAVAIHVRTARDSEVVMRRDQLCCRYEATYDDWASSDSQVVKKTPAMQETGHADSIPDSGRSPGGGNCNPLRYSCLENSMDSGAWQAKGPKG